MAQNTLEIFEIPYSTTQQVKRTESYGEPKAKRLRTSSSMDIEAVLKENDEKYVTKEEFNTCLERISKIESRLTKIEKTFESLKCAFLGANQLSRCVPSSASSVPGPPPSAAKSSRRSSKSAEEGDSSGMKFSEVAVNSVALSAQSTPSFSAMSTQGTLVSSVAARSAQVTTLSSAAKSDQVTPVSSTTTSAHGTPVTSAARSGQGTPVSSAARSAQVTPISSAAKSAQGTPFSSTARSAQGTPVSSAARSAQGTPVTSAARSAQGTPVSSAARSAQVTPVSSAARSAQGTPVTSAARSAQGTPVSSAARSAQVTPVSSAARSAQGAPVTSAARSAQGTPVSSAARSAQVTPVSSAAKSGQGTSVSSAANSAQLTPVSSASKTLQGTPPSGTKSTHGTPISPASISNQETPNAGTKAFQGTSSSAAKLFHLTTPPGAKSAASITIQATSASKSGKGVSSAAKYSEDAASNVAKRQVVAPYDKEYPIIVPIGDPDTATISKCSAANFPILVGSSGSGNTIVNLSVNTNAQEQPNVRLISNNVGKNKPRINVIPQNELLAVHPDHLTSKRNPHSYNQQSAGFTSSVGSHPRPLQLSSTGSLPTSAKVKVSSHEPAQTNVNESCSSSRARLELDDMPEEVFRYIRPKKEIYDNRGSAIQTPTNQQLVAYIDGSCRKKNNKDVYVAIVGFNLNILGTKIHCESYVGDLSHPNTPSNMDVVRQQTQVIAAYLVMQEVNRTMSKSRNHRLKIVAKCSKLIKAMKNWFPNIYPNFNVCQCECVQCDHPQRWDTLDTYADKLSDDLPRLVLASIGINVEWCKYTTGDQEENKMKESFTNEFTKQRSELLSRAMELIKSTNPTIVL